MEINASGVGKRFNRTWLFRALDHTFQTNTAITGPNGSGKSTLLQLLTGFTLPSEGTIEWRVNDASIAADEQFRHLAVAAPYLELIEEFTLLELLNFHFRFKPVRNNRTPTDLIHLAYFQGEENKPVKQFSSGMKQRLKLLLALYSDVPVVFLDEPTTNMDSRGLAWYREQIEKLDIPLVIVASNNPDEYEFCKKILDISKFKN